MKRCYVKRRNVTLVVLLLGLISALVFSAGASEGAQKKVKKVSSPAVSEGKSVKVNYTLTVDGKVVDSSSGRAPLEFKVGGHQMIPGFEKAVLGMKAGEKKSFKVSPQDGYGQENPKAIKEVPISQMPANVTPKAGMILTAEKDGQRIPVRIQEVKKDTVVLNFNHPLAGKTLNFDVEVVEIK
jgi:FKBP-type peptidyl-prolyl cis-trans isomerase 2